MPMTPAELLAVIEDADAIEPRGKRRVILEVHAPRLLGQPGKYLGHDGGLPVYGYTRRQARLIRDTILAAAAADAAEAAAKAKDPLDDGFGDGVDE